jgi:hypothetical protein
MAKNQADLDWFLEKIRYIIQYTVAGGVCTGKSVPDMLIRKITALEGRSITEVLWSDGEPGWTQIEKIIDSSTCDYQDERYDNIAIWK